MGSPNQQIKQLDPGRSPAPFFSFHLPFGSVSTIHTTQYLFRVPLGQRRAQEALRPFRVPGPERVLASHTHPDVDPALNRRIGSIPIFRSHRRLSFSAPHRGQPVTVNWSHPPQTSPFSGSSKNPASTPGLPIRALPLNLVMNLPSPQRILLVLGPDGPRSLRFDIAGRFGIRPPSRLDASTGSALGAISTTLAMGWVSAKFPFLCQGSDVPPYRCSSYIDHL